jgi:hypothetical protein
MSTSGLPFEHIQHGLAGRRLYRIVPSGIKCEDDRAAPMHDRTAARADHWTSASRGGSHFERWGGRRGRLGRVDTYRIQSTMAATVTTAQ